MFIVFSFKSLLTMYTVGRFVVFTCFWAGLQVWWPSLPVLQQMGLVNLAREHQFNSPFPGLARWAGTRELKPIWILLKQETVSDSGIIWAICKSAPRSRQITTPAPHHSVFYRPDALPVAQPTAPKHWRQRKLCLENYVCDTVTLDCDDASA